jgi:hypothetical protein
MADSKRGNAKDALRSLSRLHLQHVEIIGEIFIRELFVLSNGIYPQSNRGRSDRKWTPKFRDHLEAAAVSILPPVCLASQFTRGVLAC